MSCDRLTERLAAFADGEPDAEVDTHVQTCASCKAEVGALRETLRSARMSGAAADGKDEQYWTDFTREVRVAYYEEDQRRRRRWMFGVLGLGLAATVILFAVVLPRRMAAPEQVAMPPDPTVVTVPFAIPLETEEDLDDTDLDAVLVELDEAADAVLAAAVEDAEVVEAEPDGDPEATVETLDDDELERVLEALSKGV